MAKRRSRSRSPPRKSRKRSRTGSKRKANPALKAWVKAAKAEGYMKAGVGFKPLPKKGTAGYKAIQARYNKILGK